MYHIQLLCNDAANELTLISCMRNRHSTKLLESVAQVVGRRTQDQKVPGSNPETGLIFKVAVEL